jgi:acyl-CoA synthetase (AMP-forming)/AMP-acid ligase II
MTAPPEGTVRDWLEKRSSDESPAFRFFDDPVETLSWRELYLNAKRLAAQLTNTGIAKGESVAIMMPNGSAAVIALFGALFGGFRATMINLAAGDDAITYAFEHSGARYALVGAEEIAIFDRCSDPKSLSIFAFSPGNMVQVALHPVSSEDDALLMYTSGTTGRPKGVVHTHQSLLAGGWTSQIAHQITASDCGLCVLPIYHINALCVSVIGGLISGGSIAMAPRFSNRKFWKQIETSKATWFSVVPTIVSHLLHSDANPSQEARNRLRFGRSASSALSPDVHEAFEGRFGVCLIETMGLTETAAQILSNPLPPEPRKIGSPGHAFGNDVCILSPDLSRLPEMEQGEIAVRGPNVMRGYLNNADATAEAMTPDGWLRTGDLGHMDKDGYVFVTGRLKELIIKGGENIAPREVDEALYSHPDVIEAAAFGRYCQTYGETVEAAVVLCDGSSLSSSDLIALCRGRLGKFKSPDTIHILSDLPKGPSGKIQRRKIADATDSAVVHSV